MSMYGGKTQIALLEKGLAADVRMVPFAIKTRYVPKHPEVVRINPKGQVPVLIDGDVELFDSTQIFEYLEDAYPTPPLWPKSVAGRAVARQLELQSDEVFFAGVVRLMSRDYDDRPGAIAAARSYYDVMDSQLASSAFLTGEFGYPDIAFFMASFFGEFLGATIEARHAALLDWRERMRARLSVRSVIEPLTAFMHEAGFRRLLPDPALAADL